MGIQNQDFDYSEFNFLKKQSKRALYGVSTQPRTQTPRGSLNNNSTKSSKTSNNTTTQVRKYAKTGQSYNTNETTPRKNSSYYAKEERYSVNNNAFQQYNSKTMGAAKSNKALKTVYASTASDSEGNGRNNQSDLYGFKIAMQGRTIHDEIEDDVDLFESEDECPMGILSSNEKFAASVFTIGPNAKEISLPSFA